jgi:hypothetical protein
MANVDSYRAHQDHGSPLHRWVIPEYTQHERTRGWYVSAALVAVALVTWAVWTANFLFAVIVLLGVVVLVARHRQVPAQLTVALFVDGVAVGEAFYSYRDLKSFWIIYEPQDDVRTLYFLFRSGWRPRLPIPLQEQDPLEVRRTLLTYLEEDLERESEPVSDYIGRVLRI